MALGKTKLISEIKKIKYPNLKYENSKDADLVIVWKFLKQYKGLFGNSVRRKRYTLKLRIDETKKEVFYSDLLTDSGVETSAASFFVSKEKTKNTLINTAQKEKRYGISTEGKVGKIYEYDLNPNKIKEQVRDVCKKNGWHMAL